MLNVIGIGIAALGPVEIVAGCGFALGGSNLGRASLFQLGERGE